MLVIPDKECVKMVFLAETNAWQWILPITLGLLVGIIFSMRRRYDYSQVIILEPDEFRQNMRKGQLIDIRPEIDYKARKINGSRNYPKQSIFQNLSRFRRDQAIFIYDENHTKSVKSVARKLLRKGFQPVYILSGGLKKWNYPLKENH
jgi:rhodanese-related sulfurtransferase